MVSEDAPLSRDFLPQSSIIPGSRVVVRDSRGREHPKVALSAVQQGIDIPVIWACSEEEWVTARLEHREADGVPWPAWDVLPA